MPRTEAGKRLLEREAMNSRSFALITADHIDAIEAEAVTAALDALAAEVAGLACECVDHADCTADCDHANGGNLTTTVPTAAVLAAIEKARP